MHFACSSEMSQIVGISCDNGHAYVHTQTAKNTTTLHHPSTHSDNDHWPKTQPITLIPHTFGSVSQLFVPSFACLWMRSVESLLVNKVMGRGSSWVVAGLGDSGDRRVVGQVGRCHRQGPWVAKQQCYVLRPSSEEIQLHAYVGDVERRLTPELLDEFNEEEHGRISVRTVAIRVTLSRTCSRKALCSSQVRRGEVGEVGACIWKAHRAEDVIGPTPESGRDLLQR